VALLDELGLKYTINIASGAGFEYYTGLIFQLYAGKEKVGGGGRYDALIPAMGGGNVPASGFALYLDRLMEMLKSGPISPAEKTTILVRPLSEAAVKRAFQTAAALRGAGHIVALDMDGKKTGAAWRIAVGDKAPALTVKNLATGKEYRVPSVDAALKLIRKE
jgi:histidyl-tRNA synthetase